MKRIKNFDYLVNIEITFHPFILYLRKHLCVYGAKVFFYLFFL